MLEQYDAYPNIAVRNLKTATDFYTRTLGLKQVDSQGDEVAVFSSGTTTLNVYRSDYAGTNKATAVTWKVPDVARAVQALKAKGVKFEHYDMPGMKRDGDVHSGDGMNVAWFKDPDGNILNLIDR